MVMYTVCTFRLAGGFDAPVLLALSRLFLYIAITAWSITVAGMLLDLARSEIVRHSVK